MSGLVLRHGPMTFERKSPFEALVGAIISQQISGKAAASIAARLRTRVTFDPAALARAHPMTLGAAGLSRAKATYLRELAQFALAGGLNALETEDDDAVVERLTSVKGIGRWTAEMFLMFSLGRPDVWPVGDGGVQRAALQLYRVRSPRRLAQLGERFRPFRSHAAWYLWRSIDAP
ncbi:MAG: DNA-3-methyladenine glycosylase 2 family protein [Gemmatimonadales bacterium]